MKQKIYIAGRLNDDSVKYIKNMHHMITTAEVVRNQGFSVFIPCLDFLSGLVSGDMEYDDFFENNVPWLLCSDAIYLVPGWEESIGTQKEIEIARKHNIPVFSDMKEMLDVLNNGSAKDRMGADIFRNSMEPIATVKENFNPGNDD